MKAKLLWVLLGVMLTLLVGWQRHQVRVAEARARTATTAADSLRRRADSLAGVYHTDTVRLTRWRTRWDSIVGPGRTDTLTIERVIGVADSTIRACTAALQTCEQRVAVERERGDSLASAAANWQRVAKGPFLTPRLELTVTPQLEPEAAAELLLGRGRLRLLARAEVSDAAVLRLGVSWTP